MRNVKVMVQADTTGAVSKVRELTGALAQFDARARQSVGNALKALNGTNPASLNSNNIKDQQQLAENVQTQAGKVTPDQAKTVKKAKTSKEKTDEANKKLADKAQKDGEKYFKEFADQFAQIFAEALAALLEGGLKGGLKSFKDGLKAALQGILKQLMSNIVEQIKSAISKKIVSIFTPKGGTGTGTGTGDKSVGTGDGDNKGTTTALPDTTVHEAVHAGAGAATVGLGATNILNGANPLTPDPVKPTTSGTGGNVGSTDGKTVAQKTANAAGGPGKFQTQIASMLPGIGMSLGGALGMGQGGASMLGQAGGLLAGGIGMAFLAPGLLTSAFGGTIAGVGGATLSTGLGGAMAGLLTNPFTIAVAGALIIGAIIWGINSRRKKEEKQRSQAMLDAFSQLDDLLKQVNSDQLDGASAVTQANSVRKQYVEQMSQLKDKKTRNIALKDVSRIDDKISQIRQAGEAQTSRKAMDAKLVPTFADGGLVGTGGANYKVLGGDGASMRPFRGRVPGDYDRKDDFLARLTGNEVVLTPDVWMPIAPYLKKKRVPGFADGGKTGNSLSFTGSSQIQESQPIIIEELIIHLSNQFGAETAAKILDVGLKTSDGQQAVVKSVRTHIGENGLGDGLVRDINRVNSRGF